MDCDRDGVHNYNQPTKQKGATVIKPLVPFLGVTWLLLRCCTQQPLSDVTSVSLAEYNSSGSSTQLEKPVIKLRKQENRRHDFVFVWCQNV